MNEVYEAEFDRLDICEAHWLFEAHYNVGGIVRERPSNHRRNMSSGFQLSRMGFEVNHNLMYDTMSLNAKRIYQNLVFKYFPPVYKTF